MPAEEKYSYAIELSSAARPVEVLLCPNSNGGVQIQTVNRVLDSTVAERRVSP